MIVGRQHESALIEDFLRRWRSRRSATTALVIRGDAGLGKTLLIDNAVRGLGQDGATVLWANGYQSESRLPFAVLHQLLRPALARLDALPGGQREALRDAFAMDPVATPRPAAVGEAALTLLSGLAERGPVLMIADDMQWYDRESLEVIASLIPRVAGEPIAILAGTRGDMPFGPETAGMGLGPPAREVVGVEPVPEVVGVEPVPEVVSVELGPLAREVAELLLSRQPGPPAGPRRRRLLDQAGGNPLAVVELAKVAGDTALWPGERFPVTERLEKIYAAQVPPAARGLLALMSAAEDAEWGSVLRAAPGDHADALAQAGRAGLLDLGGDRPAFRYPLIRAAIYQATPFEERRAAHQALARVSADADRRAWHLGAAAAGADEKIAALLEAAADRADRRGSPGEALRAAERAARLTPDGRARAGRLVKAARLALYTERVSRAEQYTAQAAALTDDPEVLAQLPPLVGWAISNSGRQDAAMALLIPAAREAAGRLPGAAAGMLAVAGAAAFYSGLRTHRAEIGRCQALLAALDDPGHPLRLWVSVCADPLACRAEVGAAIERHRAAPGPDLAGRLLLGLAAALADFPRAAIELLGPLVDPEGDAVLPDSNSTLLSFYGFACLDAGRWTQAESIAGHAARIAAEVNPGLSTAMAQSLQAMLGALRGRTEEARALAHRALTATNTQSRIVSVRAERALSLAATAEGSPEIAYNHVRRLFAADGAPVHDHHSYYALADLAAAAALTGRADDAEIVLAAAAADLATRPTERLDLLMGTARGLLAPSFDEAAGHFETVLSHPAGDRWPFDRACARLEYGQRLRRNRQITRARDELTAALDVLQRLDAEPWATRARAELQASGMRPDGPPRSALDGLTAQERQIVRLAAQGLTNKEIGERLFLSHRTVSTHLYRIFPKLGVSTRAQLHAFAADDPEPA